MVVLKGLQSVGGLDQDIGVQHISFLHTLRLPFRFVIIGTGIHKNSAGPPNKGANRRCVHVVDFDRIFPKQCFISAAPNRCLPHLYPV